MSQSCVIGLDGGATKISGAIVVVDENTTQVVDCKNISKITYSEVEGYDKNFTPVALDIQLRELKEKNISLTSAEKKQGKIFVEAAAHTIQNIIKNYEGKKLIIGIGMPGLKTEDKQGIAAMANGPRIPFYNKELGEMLSHMGIELEKPVGALGSDADYCGIGELYSARGAFRNVSTAYYLGVGTGVADAMILKGNLTPFDKAKPWIAKSWELVTQDGRSFEKHISMSAIKNAYREKVPHAENSIHAGIIFDMAVQGNKEALEIIENVATTLADLLYDRIYSLEVGGTKCTLPSRELMKHNLGEVHWEKIILGQKLGSLWENQIYKPFFQQKVIQLLFEKLHSDAVYEIYIDGETIRDDLIVVSTLDYAPIIGAGISAFIG